MTTAIKDSADTINQEDAAKKARAAKGYALAETVLNFTNKEVMAEAERANKRMKFVADICALDPDGHTAFRGHLQETLNDLRMTAKAMQQEGVTKENEARVQGYSMASFTVMVSNWRTLSVACELGMTTFNENAIPMTWEEALQEARNWRQAKADAGVTVALGTTRRGGAGRKVAKPKTDYEKCLAMAVKLNKKDRAKLIAALQAMAD